MVRLGFLSAAPDCTAYAAKCLAHEHVEVAYGHCVCAADPGYQTQASDSPLAKTPAPPPPLSWSQRSAAGQLIDLTGQTVSKEVQTTAESTPGFNKWWLVAGAAGLIAAVVLYAGRK